MKPNTPQKPQTREALCELAYSIAGMSILELANKLGVKTPHNLLREKGWVGQLIELSLGCDAGSKPTADYPELGVELKTIPINHNHQPAESTYICVVPLTQLRMVKWENSVVREKLSCVLWVPIEMDSQIPLAERKIGTPLLWTPTTDETNLIRRDFEEHIEQIALGGVDSISAKQGNVLQIRPKAADSHQLTHVVGPEGTTVKTLPRGFYLRPSFTQSIIDHYYV